MSPLGNQNGDPHIYQVIFNNDHLTTKDYI